MPRTKPQQHGPPREIALPPLARFDGDLDPHGEYDAVEFADSDLAGQTAADASFAACRFERCGLDGLSLLRAHVNESLLADVHATSIDATGSTWRDSLVSGARIGALTASGATWSNLRIREARIDFVDLSTARLTDVVFEACVIDELDLTDAHVRSVSFPDSEVRQLNVPGARLSGVDLSGCALHRLRGIESLRGSILGRDQLHDLAPLLAEHLGIEIRDD